MEEHISEVVSVRIVGEPGAPRDRNQAALAGARELGRFDHPHVEIHADRGQILPNPHRRRIRHEAARAPQTRREPAAEPGASQRCPRTVRVVLEPR